MPKTNRLHSHVAEMVVLETAIEITLDKLSDQASDHPEVSELISSFCEQAGSHRSIMEARLQTLAGNMDLPASIALDIDNRHGDYPVSTALQQASTVMNHAVTGYAMLRSIALRFRDSALIGEGNTGDIAEQHTKTYVEAVHKIDQTLHNIVLWEMDLEGVECLCTCPCCGLGVCLCAQGPRRTLSDAWVEVGPISDEAEVFIHPPRLGSAAATAGLQHGDVIIAADGKDFESHVTLQGIVAGHESGETIELHVRRSSGKLEDITVVRP